MNDRFFLVDFPGFGYAKAPGPFGKLETVGGVVPFRGEGLAGVVHLVDGRHPPTSMDREMMEALATLQIPTMVTLTKMDRVPKGRREATLERASRELEVDVDQLLTFSSKTGEGREALLAALEELLSEHDSGVP